MAEKKTPPEGFLRQFRQPLWEVAKLDRLRALSIVEGKRGEFAFTVLELEHRATGLFNDESVTEISTVFIVHLNQASPHWTSTYTPADGKIWVDDRHVYLSRLGRWTPVKDWSHLLNQAVTVARTLTDTPRALPGEAAQRPARLSEGVDIKTLAFWFVFAGIGPLLEEIFGIFVLSSVVHKGYFAYCQTGAPTAIVMVGLNAWLFGLALCLPVLGHIACIATIDRYYGRPGFGWRISIAGTATVALALVGLIGGVQYTATATQLQDGSTVPCYIPA